VSKLTPQQGAAALQEALALHRQGQLAAAEKAYARILKSFPDQFDALHLLGMLKLQAGKAGEAQRLITSALKIAPNSPDAHANLGLVVQAGTPEELAETVREGLRVRGELIKAAGIQPE